MVSAASCLDSPEPLQYYLRAGPLSVWVMTHAFLKRSLACLLVLCVLAVGGLASAQSLTHDSQHAHHQKSTHSTMLCSWMCAAGQVLDTVVVPDLVERTPVALIEPLDYRFILPASLSLSASRGPPSHSIE